MTSKVGCRGTIGPEPRGTGAVGAGTRMDGDRTAPGEPRDEEAARAPGSFSAVGLVLAAAAMLFCCGGPLILGAIAAASAATLGIGGGIVGALLAVSAVAWWMRRRRVAAACCAPAGRAEA